MIKAREFRQISTIISLITVLIFSIFRVWHEFTDQRVQGEHDSVNLESALVTRVIDGDTIELSDGRKLRYIGIDTPETVHPQLGLECFGTEARNYNQQLVAGKQVYLEKDVQDVDRYGRLLRYVWIDQVLVNEKLVSDGYAYASAYPPDVKYQDRLNQAQRQARESGAGLWGKCQVNSTQEINQKLDEIDQSLIKSVIDELKY